MIADETNTLYYYSNKRVIAVHAEWSEDGLEWAVTGTDPDGSDWSASGCVFYSDLSDDYEEAMWTIHTDLMAAYLWARTAIKFSQDCFDFCADVADSTIALAVDWWRGFVSVAEVEDAQAKADSSIGSIIALTRSGYDLNRPVCNELLGDELTDAWFWSGDAAIE